MKTIPVLAAACALSACTVNNYTQAADGSVATSASQAELRAMDGVAATDAIPTDVRRATFIVRDLERSLAFWQGALGLELNYDIETQLSGVNLPVGEPGAEARLVLLNGNDPYIGWIGLMQITDPVLPEAAEPYPQRLSPGSTVIVLAVDDAERRCADAAAVEGALMTGPTRLQVYPGRGENAPDIRVRGCNVFDPDGIAVEINQLLD